MLVVGCSVLLQGLYIIQMDWKRASAYYKVHIPVFAILVTAKKIL